MTVFEERRRRVLDAMGPHSALVLGATPELKVGLDTELRYVVDSDVWYLTGYGEPEAVVVLCRDGDDATFTMFVRPREPSRERWTGARGGVIAASEQFGADRAHPVTALAEQLPKVLAGVDTIHYRLAARPDIDRIVTDAIVAARHSRARSARGPFRLVDPGPLMGGLRLFKDAAEIAAMREAARISIESYREAAGVIRPGAGEWEVEAVTESGFRRRGASGPAFPTIAASGPNATILHHVSNDRVLGAGELLLLDAGARNAMYCADITRTFPVSGRFEGAAAAVYEIVHAANRDAIAAARPGASFDEVHQAAQQTLVRGMIELKLVRGDVDELIAEDRTVTAFYPHRTSHWLGLDVHDVGGYVDESGRSRILEPGMVLTIEPGLYIAEAEELAPPGLRGIGVRLEDDVLIVDDGNEVLTAELPIDMDGVAAMVG